MTARTRWREQGATLLEVLVAIVLMAVSALGVISAQLWLARGESAVAMRERAVLIADSMTEAARGLTSEVVALKQWNASAAAVLRRADVSIREQGGGLAVSIVRWDAPQQDPASTREAALTCGDAKLSCVTLAFVR
jgi:Tfp pilus assembly protein PilV